MTYFTYITYFKYLSIYLDELGKGSKNTGGHEGYHCGARNPWLYGPVRSTEESIIEKWEIANLFCKFNESIILYD